MKWNDYGFPVFDHSDFMVNTELSGFDQRLLANAYKDPMRHRFEKAKAIAADALARNFPEPCNCAECIMARNLPSVQRILAKWIPLDRAE